jgi:hypothetical protein
MGDEILLLVSPLNSIVLDVDFFCPLGIDKNIK